MCASAIAKSKGGSVIQTLRKELSAKGIRSSHQRLRVLAYLREHRGHPTAEEIYEHVVAEIPTLSKATVYNTLHLYAEAGLLRVMDTIGADTRYDAILLPHGHFRCDACGALIDFPLDLERLPLKGLEGYQIRERHVTFKGLCPDCLARNASEKE